MQTDIGALVAVDVDLDFRVGLEAAAIGQFVAFNVSPDDVIAGTGGHALGEFAGVIGVELPADFLVALAADFDPDGVKRVSVGIEDRAEDERVGLGLWLPMIGGRRCGGK